MKLLQVNNKLDNIDNHKWRIRKDLEPLEKQIEIEILNNRYKMKIDNSVRKNAMSGDRLS